MRRFTAYFFLALGAQLVSLSVWLLASQSRNSKGGRVRRKDDDPIIEMGLKLGWLKEISPDEFVMTKEMFEAMLQAAQQLGEKSAHAPKGEQIH